VAAGLLGGGIAVLSVAPGRAAWTTRIGRVASVALGLLAVTGALAAAAPGYVTRNAKTNTTFAAPLLRWFATQPTFRDGGDPIATTAPRIGLLAGDQLRHGVDLIGVHESCTQIRARARAGWVVVIDFAAFLTKFFPTSPAGACLQDEQPRFIAGEFRVYRGPAAP